MVAAACVHAIAARTRASVGTFSEIARRAAMDVGDMFSALPEYAAAAFTSEPFSSTCAPMRRDFLYSDCTPLAHDRRMPDDSAPFHYSLPILSRSALRLFAGDALVTPRRAHFDFRFLRFIAFDYCRRIENHRRASLTLFMRRLTDFFILRRREAQRMSTARSYIYERARYR